MPMGINPETGLPEYTFDLPPVDPDNPDVAPVEDWTTPPRDPENEIEHEGVIALGDPETIPNPDKPQPPVEEPEGDEDDNDQPSGNPEDDDELDDDEDANPPAG